MPNRGRSARAHVALSIVSLVTLIACASGRGNVGGLPSTAKSTLSSRDTATIVNSEGKSVEDLFVGRFPGVTATRGDGGGIQIRIRGGNNTFYGSNEPLFVVDDQPVPPGSGGIFFLNPHDIQKIEVLKNPSDIGIYGVRGGNGVVKITTKRPNGA